MRSRRTFKGKKYKLGPNIVRAWFDTVINPLIHSLGVETFFLSSHSWTWQFRLAVPPPLPSIQTHGFVFSSPMEKIAYVRSYLDASGLLNIQQLYELYPNIKKAGEDHDNKVSDLASKCYHLHRLLKESQALRALYDRFTSPEHLSSDIGPGNIFGAYPKSDHLALLAQYIVNNQTTLPDHFSTAIFWNTYRGEFLALLSKPDFRVPYQDTLRSGNALLKSSNRLRDMLTELRSTLSLRYDTPYVSSSAPAQAIE